LQPHNVRGDSVKVQPLDSYRQRIYIAPLGLWLKLDAGKFENLELDSNTHRVRIEFFPADEFTRQARLRIEQPAKISGIGTFHPFGDFPVERVAYTIPLGKTSARMEWQ
jgi:hypothetical protein